jgi:type I restriction enzyme S subunit
LPDGWLAGQVKNAATVTLGKMRQSKDSGSDVSVPYLRAANVQPDGVLALDDVNEMWFGDAELEQLSIRAGDVVVVEGGQGGFGRAAYVDEDLPGWGFQNSINRLRPIADFDGRFIAFYLIALRASGFIRAYSNVVSMPHLTAEKLARPGLPDAGGPVLVGCLPQRPGQPGTRRFVGPG